MSIVHRGGRECHAKHSAREGKQNAVGQKLAPNPSPRSAQREPRADLAVAGRSARQKEAGHIQAGEAQQVSPSPRTGPRAAARVDVAELEWP